MREFKENDWFLNQTANPQFTPSNFRDVGLTNDNTSFASEEEYKKIPQIQQMFQTEGKFDESKFHTAYLKAAQSFNAFANSQFQDDVAKTISFHRDNIWVDASRRRSGPDLEIIKYSNPLRESEGLIKLGRKEPSSMSLREIAEQEKVLANPMEAMNDDGSINFDKAIWHDAPEESFTTDFFDTRVLAEWDQDGTHKDPVTGELVKHRKGDPKLNQFGRPYYENLDGRDIYGKKVLSKLDILTKEGTTLNKYDFFDSDGKTKNNFGTLMKTVASIAPMFIPGISPWYIGAGITLESAKLFSVLGKMFTGLVSDSNVSALSGLEGFASSFDNSVSDNAMQDPWAIENMIGMAGDVFKQLYQQRWLFQYAPAAFTGGKVIASDEDKLNLYRSFLKDTETYSVGNLVKRAVESGKRLNAKTISAIPELSSIGKAAQASEKMEKFMESYNKIGETLSQLYMTGITVQDAYGEAKEAGAGDIEAFLYMMGYAAGEYGIVNSNLGKWILPELRMSKEKGKAIMAALKNNPMPSTGKLTGLGEKEIKWKWAKNIFEFGKKIANADYSVAEKTLLTTGADALGEGVEEVSEELWKDLSNSAFNFVQWMNGGDTRLSAFDNTLQRYALNFTGGFLGGALMDGVTNYGEARGLKNMSSNQAFQELVQMSRNGTLDDFRKQVNSTTLGSKKLSAKNTIVGDDGNIYYQEGTEDDNQDKQAKDYIMGIVDFIDTTLHADGMAISDNALIDNLILKDMRYNALRNSETAGKYIQNYNTLSAEIVELEKQLHDLNSTQGKMKSGTTDKSEREGSAENSENAASEIQKQLQLKLEERDTYINGEKAAQFKFQGAFELLDAISNQYSSISPVKYVEAMAKMPYDKVPEAQKSELLQKYADHMKDKGRDSIAVGASAYLNDALRFRDFFNAHIQQSFESVDPKQQQIADELQSMITGTFVHHDNGKGLNPVELGEEFLSQASVYFEDNNPTGEIGKVLQYMVRKFGNDEENIELTNFLKTVYGEQATDDAMLKTERFLRKFAVKHLDQLVQPFFDLGYINPVVKQQVMNTLSNLSAYMRDNGTREESDAIFKKRQQIEKLRHSDTVEFLDSFSLVTKSKARISDVLKSIDEARHAIDDNDISTFQLTDDQRDAMDEAIRVIDLYETQILGAQNDQVDVDNLYSLNSLANQIDPEFKLTEINSDQANALLVDARTIKNQIEFARNIIDANEAQKLREQLNTGVNHDVLIYNKLSNLKADGWKDLDKLKQTIASLEVLSKKTTKLSEEQKLNMKAEVKALDNAIYDFFQANSDKVNDTKQMAKFVADNFYLYDDENPALNSKTESLNDRVAYWYLAARASLKADDFYGKYKNHISMDHAPLPTQVLATYVAYASLMKGNTIMKWGDALTEAVAADIESGSEEAQKRKLTPGWKYANDYSVMFNGMVFIEGLPGTGKTDGIFRNVMNMLSEGEGKQLLKKVYVVQNTKENALKLAKQLGLAEGTYEAFGIDEYYSRISPDHAIRKRPKLENGDFDIQKSDFTQDQQGHFVSTSSLNKLSAPPTLVIIDEVSNHSLLDMELNSRMQKEFGTRFLLAGDLDQSKATGSIRVPITTDGPEFEITAEITSNAFISPPRQGVVLRAANSQSVKNILQLQNRLRALREDETGTAALMEAPLTMRYSLVKEKTDRVAAGLYGVKMIAPPVSNDEEDYEFAQLTSTLDVMLKTQNKTDDGKWEKIGYIYNDESSVIYKELSQPKYKDRIEFYKGGSAQGMESQYFIIEDFVHKTKPDEKHPDGKNNYQRYWADVYTALSRAKQGSLWIESLNNLENQIENVSEKSPIISKLGKESIANYSSMAISQYKNLYPDANDITLEKFNTEDTGTLVEVAPTEGGEDRVQGPQGVSIDVEDDSGNSHEEILTSNGLRSKERARQEVMASNLRELKGHTLQVVDGKARLNLLLYSGFTTQLGLPKDDAGNYHLPSNFDVRRDGVNGIIKTYFAKEYKVYTDGIKQVQQKLADKTITQEQADKQIEALKEQLLSTKDLIKTSRSLINEIIAKALTKPAKDQAKLIYDTLEIKNTDYKDGVPYVRMVYVGRNLKGAKRKKAERSMNRDKGEQLEGIHSSASNSLDLHKKDFSIVFGVTDKNGVNHDLFENPLVVFPNYDTLLKNPELKDIKAEYDRLVAANAQLLSTDSIKGNIAVADGLINSNIPGASLVGKLMRIYRANGDLAVFIKGANEFSFAEAGTVNAPRVISGKNGQDYAKTVKDLANDDKAWIDLKDFAQDPQFKVSPVYISPTGTHTVMVNGQPKQVKFAQPGHPFVLVAKDGFAGDLISTFWKDLEMQQTTGTTGGRVSLVSVTPPKYSLKQYLESLYNDSIGKTDAIRIGNYFTPYRIIDSILRSGKQLSPDVDKAIAPSKEIVERLRKVDEKIDALDQSSPSYLDDKKQLIKEQVGILREKVSSGKGKSVTNASILKAYLRTSLFNSTIDGEIKFNEDALKIVEDSMKAVYNADGIELNVGYLEGSRDDIMRAKDDGSYFIGGQPYKVNGRLDLNTVFMDCTDIINSIYAIIKFDDNDGLGGSPHTFPYARGNSGPVQDKTAIEKIVDPMFKDNHMSKKTANTLKKVFKDKDNVTIDDVLKYLHDEGHLIISIGSSIIVTDKSKLLKGKAVEITGIQQDGLSIKEISLTLDEVPYVGTITYEDGAPTNVELQKAPVTENGEGEGDGQKGNGQNDGGANEGGGNQGSTNPRVFRTNLPILIGHIQNNSLLQPTDLKAFMDSFKEFQNHGFLNGITIGGGEVNTLNDIVSRIDNPMFMKLALIKLKKSGDAKSLSKQLIKEMRQYFTEGRDGTSLDLSNSIIDAIAEHIAEELNEDINQYECNIINLPF